MSSGWLRLAVAGVRKGLTGPVKAGEVRDPMIKSDETLVARPCENFHKALISIPAPVPTGRVGDVVESRASTRLAPTADVRIHNQFADRVPLAGGLQR